MRATVMGTATPSCERECGPDFAGFAASPAKPRSQARFRVDTVVAPP
jgi:hypothetical protein